MICKEEVRSPLSRLVYVLQQIVIKDTPLDEMNELAKLATQILQTMPSTAPQILVIQNLLSEKKTHTAFKKGKGLMALGEAFLAERRDAQRAS